MLLPDNIQPEQSIYYNGAMLLESLQAEHTQDFFDLYQSLKTKHNMPFNTFTLCVDWLFLIDMICINKNGELSLCS